MTDVHDRFEVSHLVVVTYENHGPQVVFRAECSCGWSGDGHDDNALAELDGDDHRSVAVDPADDLDGAITGLLDLQDDLAQAVMWLAEHWSADLPVPVSWGVGTDPARVDLAAYFLDPDLLDRAAATLAVPVVDDPAPDARGRRYRRASRSFGRVRLEVYRMLDSDNEVAA
jgi:hypothetical protein